MGSILKTKKLTTGFELVIVILALGVIGYGVYALAPGLRVSESKQLSSMEVDDSHIDNESNVSMRTLPSTTPSIEASKKTFG